MMRDYGIFRGLNDSELKAMVWCFNERCALASISHLRVYQVVLLLSVPTIGSYDFLGP